MFHVDKALYGPNVPVTVRFSPILHQWLREKAAKENISFNHRSSCISPFFYRYRISYTLCF